MTQLRKLPLAALRVLGIGACGLGIWQSCTLARAGFFFDQDTESSVRAAITEVPDAWPYYTRLAQFDQPNARPLLTTALELNRYDAQADVELALQYEADGQYPEAEKLFLSAFDVDRTYLPRWSLANFYLRRDNLPAFWHWARSAASMPPEDISPLFELCWRVAPDPQAISTNLLDGNPETLRQFIEFLLVKGQVHQAGLLAPSLVVTGHEIADRPLIFTVVDRLIASDDQPPAVALWRSLVTQRWVHADLTAPNNPKFARQPLPVSFDWNLPESTGVHSWPGASGLETEFSGLQPDEDTIAEQVLALAPGSYKVTYSYRTAEVAPGTGIHWQMIESKSGRLLAESADLSSEASSRSGFQASIPMDAPFVRLRLLYRRSLGTSRIKGTLGIEWVQIEAQPQ